MAPRLHLVMTAGLAALLALGLLAPEALAAKYVHVAPHQGMSLVDTSDPSTWQKAGPDQVVETKSITWNVMYLDGAAQGFNHATQGAARKARLTDALTYISNVLKETVTLDIEVQVSQADGSGFLATGGSYYSDADGFQEPISLAHARSGIDPDTNIEDVTLTVDFGFSYYTDTGSPGGAQYDLLSVFIHEITHGLGVVSLTAANGNTAAPFVHDAYSNWDELIERGSDGQRMWVGSPPAFAGAPGDLTGGGLVFGGSNAIAAYGAKAVTDPPIYAPSPFVMGSSILHWDDDITGGAVMVPALAVGDTNRTYAPVEFGMLQDLGWDNASAPPTAPVDIFEGVPAAGGLGIALGVAACALAGAIIIRRKI